MMKPFWQIIGNKIHLLGIYAHGNTNSDYVKIDNAVSGHETIEIVRGSDKLTVGKMFKV